MISLQGSWLNLLSVKTFRTMMIVTGFLGQWCGSAAGRGVRMVAVILPAKLGNALKRKVSKVVGYVGSLRSVEILVFWFLFTGTLT